MYRENERASCNEALMHLDKFLTIVEHCEHLIESVLQNSCDQEKEKKRIQPSL